MRLEQTWKRKEKKNEIDAHNDGVLFGQLCKIEKLWPWSTFPFFIKQMFYLKHWSEVPHISLSTFILFLDPIRACGIYILFIHPISKPVSSILRFESKSIRLCENIPYRYSKYLMVLKCVICLYVIDCN